MTFLLNNHFIAWFDGNFLALFRVPVFYLRHAKARAAAWVTNVFMAINTTAVKRALKDSGFSPCCKNIAAAIKIALSEAGGEM